MSWIDGSNSYQYLINLYSKIDEEDIEQKKFKLALEWALITLKEQERALLNIAKAENSDLTIPPPRPHLKVIKGGKNDSN